LGTGAGATWLPKELYRRLTKVPQSVGIYSMGRHCCDPGHSTPSFPGDVNLLLSRFNYADTLHRSGTNGLAQDMDRGLQQWRGVIFEPEERHRPALAMLTECRHCEINLSINQLQW